MSRIVQFAVPKHRPKVFPNGNYHARTYLKQASPDKSLARDRLTQVFQNCIRDDDTMKGRQLFVLSLPGAWWHFEKNLERRCGNFGDNKAKVHFTGVESCRDTFRLASLSIPSYNGLRVLSDGNVVTNKRSHTLVKAKLSDYLATCRKPFRVAWLDYFSPLNSQVLSDLKRLSNVMPRTGGILLAINVGIGRETKAITESIGELSRESFIVSYITDLFGPMEIVQMERYKEEGMKVSRLQMAFYRKGGLPA